MKTFKSFIQLDEVERAKYKEGIANKLSGVSYLAQTKDPGDLEHVGPEEMGPKGIKTASGKRPADRLDNKQPFGEAIEDNLHPAGAALLKHIKPQHHNLYKPHLAKNTFNGSYKDRHAVLKAAHDAGHLKMDLKKQNEEVEELGEEDFSPKQTKMAHTIGKEFAKKKVGDQYRGGPYAVASAMVKNKPEAAQKAYNTIKSKMKESADEDLLYKVYSNLSDSNKQVFMNRLEESAADLLEFAKQTMDE